MHGRFELLAGTLVEHGVADQVRVHEHRPGRDPVLRAAARPTPRSRPALLTYPVDLQLYRSVVESGRARAADLAETTRSSRRRRPCWPR